MKWTQATTEELDGSDTWETIIQSRQPGIRDSIKAWHNGKGYVCIESASGDTLAQREYIGTRGRLATQKKAESFVREYFKGLYDSVGWAN